MKVAMLGWEFPPFMAGGLGVHCLELTRGLARQGTAIDFYMPRVGAADVQARHGHVKVHEVAADPALDPYGGGSGGSGGGSYDRDFNRAVHHYNQRLAASFSSRDADVLHCHDWITLPAALELRQRTGIPLVFTVHSTEQDRSGGLFAQQWIEDLERRGVQEADRVIAVSRYTKRLLEKQYGADPDKVVAIDNGIDPSRFHAHGRNGRTTPPDGGSVLFLARLSRQKAPMQFLRTARRVLDVRPNTRFVMAGKGELLPECIDYTIEHQMVDAVKFAGYVPDEELPHFYAQHDLYVLPSVSEPFGISVLEAMATGLPTIVTKTSGVGGEVRHALKAEYWDVDEMADLIISILGSPELREEMSGAAIDEARRFSWDDTARKTSATYAAVGRRLAA